MAWRWAAPPLASRLSPLARGSGSALKIQPAPPGVPFGVHLNEVNLWQIWRCLFCPPGIPGPPACLLGAFCQTDFPGVSCIGLRGQALLLPHPSDTPAGLAPAGVLAQEVLPGRLPHLFRLQALGAPILFIWWSRIPQKKQACDGNEMRAWALYATKAPRANTSQ
jgi:hypothetical protein